MSKDDVQMPYLIHLIAGARPNFMKVAPIIRELKKHPVAFAYRLVHTGQHYDKDMSDVFFEELGIPAPDYHLEVGSSSHAEQTANIMVRYEKVCQQSRPDLVMVVGDVNSTLACSIVAKKLNIKVAHVEAGLRSGDLAMPEEINRMVTDAITDYFYVTEKSGAEHLLREGKPKERIAFVGHVMIDNLFHQLNQLEHSAENTFASTALKASYPEYGAVTLHRPSNVDNRETLRGIIDALGQISRQLPLIFPVHPRTQKNLDAFKLQLPDTIITTAPMPYMDFLNLFKDARLVLTDSGGIQEETTALGIPCITLRENTERPITITAGTNVLAGTSPERILQAASNVLNGKGKVGQRPELWDGRAAERIIRHLLDHEAARTQNTIRVQGDKLARKS